MSRGWFFLTYFNQKITVVYGAAQPCCKCCIYLKIVTYEKDNFTFCDRFCSRIMPGG